MCGLLDVFVDAHQPRVERYRQAYERLKPSIPQDRVYEKEEDDVRDQVKYIALDPIEHHAWLIGSVETHNDTAWMFTDRLNEFLAKVERYDGALAMDIRKSLGRFQDLKTSVLNIVVKIKKEQPLAALSEYDYRKAKSARRGELL